MNSFVKCPWCGEIINLKELSQGNNECICGEEFTIDNDIIRFAYDNILEETNKYFDNL
jgi:hypothetical protein